MARRKEDRTGEHIMNNPLYFARTENKEKRIVESGSHKGIGYEIVSYGSHPCAYISLPKKHKLHGVNYQDISLCVHGGLTYAEMIGDFWVIGWDYAHAGDLFYQELRSELLSKKGKEWTIDEIKDSIKIAIEKIPNLRKRTIKKFYYSEEEEDWRE